MNAQELFEFLQKLPPEKRAEQKVFIRIAPKGIPLNVRELDLIEDTTYGFFGLNLPCLVLNDSRFVPEEEDNLDGTLHVR